MAVGPVRRNAQGDIIDTGHSVMAEGNHWWCNCGWEWMGEDGAGRSVAHLYHVVQELLEQDKWWRKLWRRLRGPVDK